MDPAFASLAGMVAVQAVAFTQQFLPDVSEVRKADPAEHVHFTEAIRAGQVAATAGTAAVAVTAAIVSRSPVPLLVGAGVLAAMFVVYEALLRKGANQ